jgi:hypothetical protein
MVGTDRFGTIRDVAGPSMIGELLYHLHRHVRLVLIAGGLMFVIGAALLGYEAVRHRNDQPSRPAPSSPV